MRFVSSPTVTHRFLDPLGLGRGSRNEPSRPLRKSDRCYLIFLRCKNFSGWNFVFEELNEPAVGLAGGIRAEAFLRQILLIDKATLLS